MKRPSVYILVNHGSKDPENQQSLELLIEQIKTQIEPVEVLIEGANLEASETSLAMQVESIAQKAASQGIEEVKILPLFLLSGVHVRQDIPLEIAKAQTALGTKVKLKLLPHLGSYPELVNLLKKTL